MHSKLLQRLVNVFGAPQSEDPQGYIGEISALIEMFSPEEQNKAADIIIRTSKWFPKPQEVVAACIEAKELLAPKGPQDFEKPKHLDWTKEALMRADRMIQSEIGRTAADEGWILGLWDHYRKTGRQPTPREVLLAKEKASDFDADYRAAITNDICRVLNLPRLGNAILARRERKTAIAHGMKPQSTSARGKMAAAGDA